MNDFLKKARRLAFDEIEKTKMPIKLHVDLSCEVGKKLAEKLGASADIVEAGTLLMDCLIGKAIQENRLQDHVQMSLDKTNELLEESSLSEKEKENIRHCVSQHHGAKKFYSLESEICCNADCYRFVSTKGIAYALRFLRDMPFDDLTSLLTKKFEEKSNALTLDVCKKELKKEMNIASDLLTYLLKK